VHEGAEGRVEPLHEGDAAGLASIALLPPRDLLDEDAALGRQRIGPEREQPLHLYPFAGPYAAKDLE